MANTAAALRSIVAWYGSKPPALVELIGECQCRISQRLEGTFRPYAIEQVHSTLISLDPPGISRPAAIDLNGLLRFLRATPRLPLRVRIGGFEGRFGGFTSRGQSPYSRSFALRDGKAVVIGWPFDPTTRDYPMTLDALRRDLQSFGVRHHYHRTPTDIDNDAYFRIGLYDVAMIESSAIGDVEAELRGVLADCGPTIVDIALENLSVAISRDETLAPHSTRVFTIRNAAELESIWMRVYSSDRAVDPLRPIS